MDNLKPCLFCGGKAESRAFSHPFRNGWVGCRDCKVFINWIKNGEEEAVKSWNRRSKDA